MFSLGPIFKTLADKGVTKLANMFQHKVVPLAFNKAGKFVDWASNKIGSKFGNQDYLRRIGYDLTNKFGRKAIQYTNKNMKDLANNAIGRYMTYQKSKASDMNRFGQKIQNLNNNLQRQIQISKIPMTNNQKLGYFDSSSNLPLFSRPDPKRQRNWDQQSPPSKRK